MSGDRFEHFRSVVGLKGRSLPHEWTTDCHVLLKRGPLSPYSKAVLISGMVLETLSTQFIQLKCRRASRTLRNVA